MRKIVVIGGSAAGMTAAMAAARQDPGAQVTVVTSEQVPYRRPAIPAMIAGYITTPAEAAVFPAERLAKYNIKLICPAKAADIDLERKTITVAADGKEEKSAYDAAVLATGSLPMIAKIAGADKKGVCTFTTYESAAEIVEAVKTAGSAVVIGAGFIALEIAEALLHKGLNVYFNVRSRMLRKLLEPDVSEFLSSKFEQKGLKMLAGEAISEIGGKNHVEYIVYKSDRITANLVVMGTGVRPNITFAKEAGVELGPSGAIRVDNRMATSAVDIYAAGDCAESPDLATGRFVYLPVGSIGAMAGKIAGANAAGAERQTRGFLRAQADEILGMQIFSIGHSSISAAEINLKVNVHSLNASAAAEFQTAKLLTDADDKIVGAQLVAKKHGSQFAWQLYRAVLEGQTKEEFLRQFHSPRTKVAQAMVNALKSRISVETAGENMALKLEK